MEPINVLLDLCPDEVARLTHRLGLDSRGIVAHRRRENRRAISEPPDDTVVNGRAAPVAPFYILRVLPEVRTSAPEHAVVDVKCNCDILLHCNLERVINNLTSRFIGKLIVERCGYKAKLHALVIAPHTYRLHYILYLLVKWLEYESSQLKEEVPR